MTRPTTLSESWEAWEADRPITAATPSARVADKRTWMSGAAGALRLVLEGRKPEELMAEVMQYARTIGRPEERATN